VVVATHERPDRLAAMLDALREQTVGVDRFEVVVVDDGSGETTQRVLAEQQAQDGLALRSLRHPQSRGPAAARNTGWRAAGGPLIAFTDDDCEPDPGWLEALLATADAHSGAAVQGRTEPIPREAAGAGPFSRTLTVKELGPFFQTCNIAYSRTTLERLGGFDEAYPAPGGEDTDLAFRAIGQGERIVYAEDALVFHAVNQYGPLGKLRWALHWSDSMRVFGDHPSLRSELEHGVFWRGTHSRLLLAGLGLLLGRRFWPAYLLAFPYLRNLRGRCKVEDAGLILAPYFLAYDAVETFATVRGAVRHRVLIL
jgi:glycosyltransferase involved in cell wall biosynthesis